MKYWISFLFQEDTPTSLHLNKVLFIYQTKGCFLYIKILIWRFVFELPLPSAFVLTEKEVLQPLVSVSNSLVTVMSFLFETIFHFNPRMILNGLGWECSEYISVLNGKTKTYNCRRRFFLSRINIVQKENFHLKAEIFLREGRIPQNFGRMCCVMGPQQLMFYCI